jgi:hypothetical protein
MLASNNSTVVEQSSHNPKFEGSNPGAAGTGKERIAQKSLKMFIRDFVLIPSFRRYLAVLWSPSLSLCDVDQTSVGQVVIGRKTCNRCCNCKSDETFLGDAIAEPLYALIGEVFDMRGVFKILRKSLIAVVQVNTHKSAIF